MPIDHHERPTVIAQKIAAQQASSRQTVEVARFNPDLISIRVGLQYILVTESEAGEIMSALQKELEPAGHGESGRAQGDQKGVPR